MRREFNFDGMEAAPRWIAIFLGANLLVHLLVLYVWNAAGQVVSLQGSSGGTSALSVTGMAMLNLWLCLMVLKSFPAGQPLRSTWLLLTVAAAVEGASGVVGQVLGTDWLLNPLTWAGSAGFGWIEQIRLTTLFASGPVHLALLATAMAAVLRILQRYGFWVRPSAADWAVPGIACLFALCRFGEACVASLAGKPGSLENCISLAGLPLLCVLFLEAMLLRQSVLRMGNGLIARVWMALVCGILLTGAGEAVLWVIPHYSQTLPLAISGILIRLLIAAAFALAPACQLAAQHRAFKPDRGISENVGSHSPVLAR